MSELRNAIGLFAGIGVFVSTLLVAFCALRFTIGETVHRDAGAIYNLAVGAVIVLGPLWLATSAVERFGRWYERRRR